MKYVSESPALNVAVKVCDIVWLHAADGHICSNTQCLRMAQVHIGREYALRHNWIAVAKFENGSLGLVPGSVCPPWIRPNSTEENA